MVGSIFGIMGSQSSLHKYLVIMARRTVPLHEESFCHWVTGSCSMFVRSSLLIVLS